MESEKGQFEETIIELMDNLDNSEKSLKDINDDVAKREKQLEIDLKQINEKISIAENKISENQKEFDNLIKDLSANIKSKFNKLLNSRGGKGITKLEDETCGNCNTRVPASVALDASKGDNITNCTNCGRFIY